MTHQRDQRFLQTRRLDRPPLVRASSPRVRASCHVQVRASSLPLLYKSTACVHRVLSPVPALELYPRSVYSFCLPATARAHLTIRFVDARTNRMQMCASAAAIEQDAAVAAAGAGRLPSGLPYEIEAAGRQSLPWGSAGNDRALPGHAGSTDMPDIQ